MTTKSTLKAADWDLLKGSPQLIETMMTEHRSGRGALVDKRYQHILDKVITEYKTNNALVNDVQEFNRNPTLNSAITFEQAQKKMEQIGTLLENNVDSPDADAIREFLLTISQHFAEETSEGLFGMGSNVSDKETEILDIMKVALKATDTDAQRREREAQQEKAKAKAAEEATKKREAEAKAKAEAAEEAAKKREAEAKAKAQAEEEAAKKREAKAKAEAEAGQSCRGSS
ncbi:MAG: hypothetical protein KDJ52_23905 [Anaerolineae bacterium]|nr:hypothetical protein [Anaerolineae bacterium]